MQALRQCHRQLKRPFTVLCWNTIHRRSTVAHRWPRTTNLHHCHKHLSLHWRGQATQLWVNAATLKRGSPTPRSKRGGRLETPEVEFSEASTSERDSDLEEGWEEGWEIEEGNEEEVFDFSDSPSIDTGGTSWGAKGLEIARRVLEELGVEGLELYAFRAIARGGLLDIRLDQLADKYGSPTLEEVEKFAKAFYFALEAELGEEEAGRISVEVSSPGADREIKLPQDMTRFKDLPMSVTYLWVEDGTEKKDTRVLQVIESECTQETAVWQLANVKVNRLQGRQNLTKKQKAQRFSIPYANIAKTNLFIEV